MALRVCLFMLAVDQCLSNDCTASEREALVPFSASRGAGLAVVCDGQQPWSLLDGSVASHVLHFDKMVMLGSILGCSWKVMHVMSDACIAPMGSRLCTV